MNFYKVSIHQNGTMHVAKDADSFTLCGREWFFTNNHGDSYCQTCQYILANSERLLTKRAPDSRYARAKKQRLAKERKLKELLGLQ